MLTGSGQFLSEALAARRDITTDPTPIDGRVLVVEDNPVNQAVAVGMLTQLGCEVEIASNGEAALESLAGEDFRLVLMDCQMPVMDGFQATREIRSREGPEEHVPIVALTANALQGDRQRCLAVGMDDYLSKPFTIKELQEVLARWVPTSVVELPPAPPTGEDPAESDEPLLDQTALDNIRQLQGPNGTNMLDRVIELYLTSSPDLMAELRSAMDGFDAERVRQAAHALKSSSANLGATRFAEYCRQLEEIARNDNLGHGNELYRKLRNLYPRIVSALQAIIQRKSA